jgi:hypothetical protein
MKRTILLIAILFGTIYAASAQYYNNTNNSGPLPKFGVGISSGFSTGPVSGAFPEAGALSFNFEIPINKSQVSLLLSTGYTFYVSQAGYGLDFGSYGVGGTTYYGGSVASFIPVEAGLKINLPAHFFIEGYAGASFNVNAYPGYFTGRTTAFIYSPGAGYSFQPRYNGRSNFDLSLLYENRPEPGGGYAQVAVKAVWNFTL